MISSIEWIPAGIADPNPKKYELSSTEQELIQMIDDNGNFVTTTATTLSNEKDIVKSATQAHLSLRSIQKKNTTISDTATTRNKIQLPKIENQLPPDLRMDEYSSDDDDVEGDDGNENDDEDLHMNGKRSAALGRLLVGADDADDDDERMDIDDLDEHDADDIDNDNKDHKRNGDDDDDSDDDDHDDDLADVPDTREYEPIDVEGLEAMGLGHNANNDHDNYDDDESEQEDVALTRDDALLVVAKTEDDFASLEIYVYDQKNGNLFVHHDIPLPAFPLCLAHGQVSHHAKTGNFCAVGTFNPGIEIWNLDVLNALEPSCVLGGEDDSLTDELMKLQIINSAAANGKGTNNKPKASRLASKNKSGLRPGSHTDAVMSLSWNPIHKQVLASGSADCTVKLWDVTKATNDDAVATTYTHHKNKVQSVAWNPKEGTLLATGSYDRTVAILDARTNGKNSNNIKHVRIPADCETIVWDPIRTEYLTVVSEDGNINCWDVRKFDTSTPLWSFNASEYGGVTDLSYNSLIPGLMVTCSIDKTVTLWDAHNTDKSSPSILLPPKQCGSKDMCVGKLYSVGFYPSSPWLLGCGGSGNELALWDLSSEESIQKSFQQRMTDSAQLQESSIEPTDDNAESRQVISDSFEAMMSNEKLPDEGDNTGDEKTSSTQKKNKKKKGKIKPKVHRKI